MCIVYMYSSSDKRSVCVVIDGPIIFSNNERVLFLLFLIATYYYASLADIVKCIQRMLYMSILVI